LTVNVHEVTLSRVAVNLHLIFLNESHISLGDYNKNGLLQLPPGRLDTRRLSSKLQDMGLYMLGANLF